MKSVISNLIDLQEGTEVSRLLLEDSHALLTCVSIVLVLFRNTH